MKNPYKNLFHIEPTHGLLNDPNGLIQFKGKYYFFHQWNRFELDHSYKEWGLFTSKDLIEWSEGGSAILPDSHEDFNGVYSGSAIEHDEMLYIFYTGNSKEDGKRKSYQRIATSIDGQTFIKQKGGIETPSEFTEHHRDPKVWKENDKWWMIVGTQTKEEIGAISLFSSNNLNDWDYEGIVFTDDKLDQMCECPDLFNLNSEVDILICCPQKRTPASTGDEGISSYAAYYVGEFDRDRKQFIPTSDIYKIDEGFDFYAAQSFMDDKGRRIVVGWMSRMKEEDEKACPTNEFNYIHCLTMPREFKWVNGTLLQLPLDEYKKLRENEVIYNKKSESFKVERNIYEISIDFFNKQSDFSLSLNNDNIGIQYNGKDELVIGRVNWNSKMLETKTLKIKSLSKLHVFCDASAMEIFINGGERVFSMRYFCQDGTQNISYEGLEENDVFNFYTYKEDFK